MEEGLGTAMRPSLSEDLRPPSPELWDTMERKKRPFFATDGLFFTQQHIINIMKACYSLL